MDKLTIKAVKELLELGEDIVLKETDEGMQYTLIADGETFLGLKRQWYPEHPVEEDGWLVLSIRYGVTPRDVVKTDIVQLLDDLHQEWVDELAGLDE